MFITHEVRMNVIVQIPHGPLLDFAPTEARKAAAYLATRLPHVTEFEQGAHLRAMRRRESETERENRMLREENAALRRVLQGVNP